MPRYIQVPDDYVIVEGQSEYTPPDVVGLKAKRDELLGELKQKDIKSSEKDIAIKKLQSELNSGGTGDAIKLKDQLDDALKSNSDLQSTYDNLVKANTQNRINTEASRLASELATHPGRASTLAEKIAGRLSLEGDSFLVLDAKGNFTNNNVKQLQAQMSTELDWLCDGSQATGGGATGGSGGATDTKTMPRSDFDAMSIPEQGKFMSSGGRPVND